MSTIIDTAEELADQLTQIDSRLDTLESAVESSDSGAVGPTSLWYDVTDYGAAGDGSANDTEAIQAAVDAAESEGADLVYFPGGDYLIDESLVCAEGVPLLGAGPYQTTIHQTDPSEHGIDLKGAGNLSIERLGVTHDHGLAEQQRGQCIFSGSGVQNVTIQHCAIEEPARQGVGLWSGDNRNIRFDRNDLRDCARAGVVIFGEGVSVQGNYLNGTGDDAIATNTDHTTHCLIAGNIVIDGAGVGQMTGGGIKFHGRNTEVANNVVIDSNQYAIRGQIVDNESGRGTAQPPTRNLVDGNIIQGITNLNPNTRASAAIELRQFENAVISNNGIHDTGAFDGVRIRNDDGHTTYLKATGNFIKNADRAFHFRRVQNYAELSDNTMINVDRVVEIEDPIRVFHMFGNGGDTITERNVTFSSVDAGSYHIRNNWYTNTASPNAVEGSVNGGTINNYLNVPGSETDRVRSNAEYGRVRWSDLSAIAQ